MLTPVYLPRYLNELEEQLTRNNASASQLELPDETLIQEDHDTDISSVMGSPAVLPVAERETGTAGNRRPMMHSERSTPYS